MNLRIRLSQNLLYVLSLLGIFLPSLFHVKIGPDLWWHLKYGLQMIQERSLIRMDQDSFVAGGAEWINHEWLTEILFGLCFQWAGDTGLFLLRFVLFTAMIIGLLYLYYKRWPHALGNLLILWLALPYLTLFMNLRAHNFTYALVVFYLVCFELYRQERRGIIWAFPLAMIFWVNLHGGFIFGLAMLAVFALEQKDRKLGWILLLSLGVTLLNPYGVKLYAYIFKEMTADHGDILEWQPLLPTYFWRYSLFAIAPFLMILATRAFRHKTEILFFILACIMTAMHRRFYILLTIFGSLMLVSSFAKTKPLKWFQTTFALCILCLFTFPRGVLDASVNFKQRGLHLDFLAISYPVRAVDFLKAQGLGPNLVLPLQWGGYALYHLSPQYKVSVDGRNLALYPKNYVANYLRAYRLGDLEALFGGHRVHAALVENSGPTYDALHKHIGWKQVHRDATAAVFVPISKNLE